MSSVEDRKPGRRARLRAQTTAEIKRIALEHMAEQGADAISLRAIAREMDMSGSAIYSYFDTRDDLISTLIGDVYTALVDAVEAARDAVPADDPGGRITAWGEALRTWSLANPQGFRLIYGDPVSGYRPPADGPAPEAAKRACLGLVGLIAAAWPTARALQDDPSARWSDFSEDLVAKVLERDPDLPPAAVALALRTWGRMHGLVALELHGHLGPQAHHPDRLYRRELLDLVRSLGLPAA
ncbi:TetR/AcrR family transcriptional regulator [Kitasatospora sp. Ki12]|uniref:TetR/AcrR family transcriptional regulator n=1 Tax=Kitasatospora xanthocidica TaxID=83382 RepID=UPI001674CDF2